MSKTIAFANLKGGTGKTTLCLNVAAHMAQHNSVSRVLVVDFDPQANATSGLGVDRETLSHSIYDALLHQCDENNGVPIDQIIVETSLENLHLAPSELDLGTAIMVMHPAPDRVSLLHRLLDPIRSFYDYILIDTPSDMGLFVLNCLRAANQVVAPTDASIFALEALQNLKLYCRDLEQMTNYQIDQFTVILNRFTKSKGASKKSSKPSPAEEILAAVKTASYPVFTVPESVLVYRAQQAGVPVLQYAPHSRINNTYRAIANHLLSPNLPASNP